MKIRIYDRDIDSIPRRAPGRSPRPARAAASARAPSGHTAFERFATRAQGPMPPGAVLLHARGAAFQAPGGGEVQLLRTAEHLATLGLPVRPFQPWIDRLEDARLLHLFGLSREGLDLATIAKRRGVPVALSTICWYEPSALLDLSPSATEAVRGLAGWGLRRLWPRLPSWKRDLIRSADALLPNSRTEARQLVRLFGADPSRIRVVPNGVEDRRAVADADSFRRAFGLDDFLLYAGRIEPRKGVLPLVRAARSLAWPLVVIGAAPAAHRGYEAVCRAEGGAHVRWLGRLDPDDPRLAAAMKAARVLALPSWFETPGLAALEAASLGTPVVVTPYGCTHEYFGDLVEYAGPRPVGAIVRAIERAARSGPRRQTELAELVHQRYLWAIVARRTAEVYDEIAPRT